MPPGARGGASESEDKSMRILKRIYGAMDGDGEGGVDEIELIRAFQKYGVQISPIQAQRLFVDMDVDGDGQARFDGFSLHAASTYRR